MLNRRRLLRLASAGLLTATMSLVSGPRAGANRLVLVHGRDQQGKDPGQLKAEWIDALHRGAERLGRSLPTQLNVLFPYYGDVLDDFARQFDVPLTTDIQTRGSAVDDEFLAFQAEIAEALRQRAGITDDQVNAEYGPNPKPKGPQNWEWVQAILRALDKYGGGLSQAAIETLMRDVFLYTRRAGVRDEIDRIVAGALTLEPTVVVGHSLGSVVAYQVLRSDPRPLQVPLFVTIGSPLGIRAIRNEFRPLRSPSAVGSWYNAFDERDVVALYALDEVNFPVRPKVENYREVKNYTKNRHGIVGYLDDPAVAKRILGALAGCGKRWWDGVDVVGLAHRATRCGM